MTGSNDIVDIRKTFDAWGDVTLKVLRKKIAILGIGKYRMGKNASKFDDHETLFESLKFVINSASEDSMSGTLSYNEYGKFVDMGVGRNYYKGNPGYVEKKHVERKRKEWQSRVLYAQVMRLGEIYREKYGESTAKQLVAMIQSVKDLKAGAYK